MMEVQTLSYCLLLFEKKKRFNKNWLLHKFNKLLDNIVILQIWIIIYVG